MRRIADLGRALRQLPHDRAVLADAGLAADRAQRHLQRHGDHRRVQPRASPGISTRIPFENGFISEVLAERGWNTYCVGKWHLTPGEECNLAAYKGRWPLGPGLRALLRLPRRRVEQLVPGPRPRQPPDRPAGHARGGLPPVEGPLGPGHRVHPRRQGRRPRQAVLHVPGPAGRPRPAPRPEGVGRPVQGPLRPGLRGHPAEILARQKELGLLPEDTELSPINPHGEPHGHRARRASRGRCSTRSGRGTR